MSAIAIPLPSRQTSRGRTDEPVAGSASDRGARQSSRRPRLRLVTDDFVPEVPVRRSLEGARRPVPASAGVATLPAVSEMRRPVAPVALRGRRADLERLAPQHPAVRAAGLRRAAQQEGIRRGGATQSVGKREPVVSRPREVAEVAVRSRSSSRPSCLPVADWSSGLWRAWSLRPPPRRLRRCRLIPPPPLFVLVSPCGTSPRRAGPRTFRGWWPGSPSSMTSREPPSVPDRRLRFLRRENRCGGRSSRRACGAACRAFTLRWTDT